MTKGEEKERERQREENEIDDFFRSFRVGFYEGQVKKRTKKNYGEWDVKALTRMIQLRHDIARVCEVRSSAVMEFVSKQLLLLKHV